LKFQISIGEIFKRWHKMEHHDKERSPNDQRSDAKNPNNPEHKDAVDNRSDQKNPNNPEHKDAVDNRSNQKNPNNPEHKDAVDNRSDQKNPNNPSYEKSREGNQAPAKEARKWWLTCLTSPLGEELDVKS